jgi:hypothetical protein
MIVVALPLLRVGIGSLKLGADANRLAQAQVQRELCRPIAEIGWDGCLAR